MKRFLPVTPNDRGTPRLDHLKTLRDMLKVLRYSTKMPFEGYDEDFRERSDKKIKGGSIEQSDKKLKASIEQSHTDLQPIHHYRLFRFMRKHTVWDAWLAGGEGAELLRDVRKAALKAARGTD